MYSLVNYAGNVLMLRIQQVGQGALPVSLMMTAMLMPHQSLQCHVTFGDPQPPLAPDYPCHSEQL